MGQNKRVEFVRYFGIVFIVFGLIYGFRLYTAKQTQRCSSLCMYDDNTSELNENYFSGMVRPLIRGERRSNLIIFLDPARECPVCLYETEYWLSPLDTRSDFMVHFFFPRQTNQDSLNGYLNAFNLKEDQINYFDNQGTLQDLIAYGLDPSRKG